MKEFKIIYSFTNLWKEKEKTHIFLYHPTQPSPAEAQEFLSYRGIGLNPTFVSIKATGK